MKKDYDQAEAYYKRALEIEPGNALTLYNYAVLLHTVREDLDTAAHFYERCVLTSVPLASCTAASSSAHCTGRYAACKMGRAAMRRL